MSGAQPEAQFDGTERQARAPGVQGHADDGRDLAFRLVEPGLVQLAARRPDGVDAQSDFRLAHQERAALLRAVGRVAGTPRSLRPADSCGHGLAEFLLTRGEARHGRGWGGRCGHRGAPSVA